ncbi:MAG: hypothetical protein H6874_01430 [Hyphomicrobiaceae bacterium]|nr:hypothetical protein [Hyphomicrobiaceae bacterium]
MDALLLPEDINQAITRFLEEQAGDMTRLEAVEVLLRDQLIQLGLLKLEDDPEPWEVN